MQLHVLNLLFPIGGLALMITSPGKDSEWQASQAQKVTYDSVSTDPTSVDILLVNMHVYPTVSMDLGTQVDATSGMFEIPADKLKGVAEGTGYQINFVSTSNNGILAQSGTFSIQAQTDASANTSSPGHNGSSGQSAAADDAVAVAATTSASPSHATTGSSSPNAMESQSTSDLALSPTDTSSATPSTTPNTGAKSVVVAPGYASALLALLAVYLA